MKQPLQVLFAIVFFFSGSIVLSAFSAEQPFKFKMPWKAAGLTEKQAAAHLISRFTFGNKPGLIDEMADKGLENWFVEQLDGRQNDEALTAKLREYDALGLSNEQVLNTFPRNAKILKLAIDEGFIDKDSVNKSDKEAYRDKINEYMEQKGYRPQKELYRQFANQKILTATYSNNQLHQVLTEFWFNHFNVSATKNDCSQFIPAYERDVIKPNVTGKFGDLLLATAQSPAMLFYLDNFNSSGKNAESEAQDEKRKAKIEKQMREVMEGNEEDKGKKMEQLKKRRQGQDLNENYAREVMELHTLGVDGGYTQTDVTEAAKVLTGWTVYPLKDLGPSNFARKLIDKFGEDNLIQKGFVHKGDFFFALNRHDDKEKKVMGKAFAAGGGYNEGVELINMLAHHASTAKFIAKKLAVRFVSDNPPQTLIDKMAASFAKNDGDIKEVLITMVSSPEFWQKEALREKTKSPFELTISAVRALDANVEAPFMLYQWIAKMGQKLYYYQAPTGFPDKGPYWINTGSLLYRMKFGLALASQKIPGVTFNLAALNNNHEPESAEDALKKYSKIILPERNLDETIKRLEPMINDPSIQQKIETASDKNIDASNIMMTEGSMMSDDEGAAVSDKNISEEKLAKKMMKKNIGKDIPTPMADGNNSMLAQVVGIILGSPEFQRR